jgi:hypothetical protein
MRGTSAIHDPDNFNSRDGISHYTLKESDYLFYNDHTHNMFTEDTSTDFGLHYVLSSNTDDYNNFLRLGTNEFIIKSQQDKILNNILNINNPIDTWYKRPEDRTPVEALPDLSKYPEFNLNYGQSNFMDIIRQRKEFIFSAQNINLDSTINDKFNLNFDMEDKMISEAKSKVKIYTDIADAVKDGNTVQAIRAIIRSSHYVQALNAAIKGTSVVDDILNEIPFPVNLVDIVLGKGTTSTLIFGDKTPANAYEFVNSTYPVNCGLTSSIGKEQPDPINVMNPYIVLNYIIYTGVHKI